MYNSKNRKSYIAIHFFFKCLSFINKCQNIYIFEGLRSKEYMKVFNPEAVLLIGSHLEKEYAKVHGYGFIWSFPMVSAIQSKMGRGWSYPATRQLQLWINEISKFRRVTFFLQEDTQPLGVFLVYVCKLIKNIIFRLKLL